MSDRVYRVLRRLIERAAGGSAGPRLVLALHLLGPVFLLHHAADPRPGGRRRRRQQSAMAVHRHSRRHAGAEHPIRLSRQEIAAQPLHPDHLPLLRRQYRPVRSAALLVGPGADDLGRTHLLHLGFGIQSVRRLGVLADERRSVQPRAGQAAVRRDCRRGDDRRDRRLEPDRVTGALRVADLSVARSRDPARSRGVQRRPPVAAVADLASAADRRAARRHRSAAACSLGSPTPSAHAIL